MTTPADFEIETYSGLFVDTKNPDPATIRLSDISHALSQTCRYGGHCRAYYSVAEHAVLVSKRLERKGYGWLVQLAGLHHDDAEAYLGDIPRPMKPLLGKAYERLSDRMDKAILIGLELPLDVQELHLDHIKSADNWALWIEARYLLVSQGRGWADGGQGAAKWGLEVPSRVVTPDYWTRGLNPVSAREGFERRHASLIERINA